MRASDVTPNRSSSSSSSSSKSSSSSGSKSSSSSSSCGFTRQTVVGWDRARRSHPADQSPCPAASTTNCSRIALEFVPSSS
ncbi:hypothetical protein EKG83_36780 [Saccharothrix syringae]|uniref:Uncharacterized protein n=1 Tax=Saccharothrix syringae TaxID=103733 RepID=A0A5Q0H7N3_SACSY|nr:hypothetical protein EKG83_36780 [Saccharothrix syringae]